MKFCMNEFGRKNVNVKPESRMCCSFAACHFPTEADNGVVSKHSRFQKQRPVTCDKTKGVGARSILLTFARADSLRRDRRLSCSQDVFLNLAGRSLGKFFDEGDAVRRLEMREVRPRKLAQLAFLSVRALL